MPRPVSSHSTYLPGLDGLRAVAVIAVILYHLDVSWMSGGLLGVGMFFTLSGYLITMILLRTWERRESLELKTFYLRRARRLFPAVVMLLVVVLAATVLVAPSDLPSRLGESVAALFYVFNWTTIASNTSYFDAFAGPGPLDHLWSLSVEEQFYVFWPLLLLGLLRLFKVSQGDAEGGARRRVAWATLGLAALSFVLMAVVAEPGFDNTRAYEGTDTRAGGLLLGAALAMVWRPERLSSGVGPRFRAALDLVGLASLAVIGWLFVTTDPFALSLYSGGLLTLSIATALLVAVVVHPASRLARALGVAPMVWIGERSYGIYLWHLPIIAFTPATVLSDSPVLLGVLQVLLTLGLSALSWTIMEDPIRRHGFRAVLFPRRHTEAGRTRTGLPAIVRGTAVLAVLGIVTLAVLPVVGGTARQSAAADPVAGGTEPANPGDAAPTTPATGQGPSATPSPTGSATGGTPTGNPSASPSPDPSASGSPSPSSTPTGPPTTGCDHVVHIGDSTSRGLFNPDQLPDPDTRMDAQYEEVGVEEVHDEVFPAMSVVETYEDEPNADTRVSNYMEDGYEGCWVFALGTQDAANQAVGGVVPLGDRIDRLMEQVDDQSALWMTGKALEQEGPWGDPEIQKWNEAVVEACERWPNMRVYDWRAEVADDWYDADGIHFIASGDVERADRIATALAVAFPADGQSPDDCVVTTEQ